MTFTSNIATAGAPLGRAKAAMVLLHGRGAAAESMLSLAEIFGQRDVAYLAPQAPGRTWYPYSFMAPIEQNEPYLSRSLAAVGDLVTGLSDFGLERTILLGFSQGGCLALEFAARNTQRYGGVVGLSAGLIGPENVPRIYGGSLARTPVFLGCSDIDAHIPLGRVRESTKILSALGGNVVERIYPGMGHTINDDEIGHIRSMLADIVGSLSPVPDKGPLVANG